MTSKFSVIWVEPERVVLREVNKRAGLDAQNDISLMQDTNNHRRGIIKLPKSNRI